MHRSKAQHNKCEERIKIALEVTRLCKLQESVIQNFKMCEILFPILIARWYLHRRSLEAQKHQSARETEHYN